MFYSKVKMPLQSDITHFKANKLAQIIGVLQLLFKQIYKLCTKFINPIQFLTND